MVKFKFFVFQQFRLTTCHACPGGYNNSTASVTGNDAPRSSDKSEHKKNKQLNA